MEINNRLIKIEENKEHAYIAFNQNGILDSGYIKEDVIAEVEYTEAINNIMNSLQNLGAPNTGNPKMGR